jgi:hypothetical protein
MHTQARLDGAEYFHRTNDDISYMSAGWITASVRALASSPCIQPCTL